MDECKHTHLHYGGFLDGYVDPRVEGLELHGETRVRHGRQPVHRSTAVRRRYQRLSVNKKFAGK